MPKAVSSSGKKSKSPRTNGTAKAKKPAYSEYDIDLEDLMYDDSDTDGAVSWSDVSSQSSPEAAAAVKGKSKAAKATDRKRRSPPEDANGNKKQAGKATNEPTAPAASNRKQQRRSEGLEKTEPILVNGGALACPLVRKSLPAGKAASTAAKSPEAKPKSCPLPKKGKAKSPVIKLETPEDSEDSNKEENTSIKLQWGRSSSLKRQDIIPTQPKEVHKTNSIEEGRRILQWIINPVLPENFFTDYWEKNACLVQRKNPKYYSDLISFKMIDDMLIRHHLQFTINLDITSYKDGKRETLNPEGRAMPPAVWGFYADGCSIRLLNPSTYLPGLRQVCSILQEFFHCLVGANVYLTPPNSQGFAPHYDDIEAFVVQVEGRKRWRLYEPPHKSDLLARISSGNYDQEQLGQPILDEVLEAGDVLYFPRGTVHQAITEKNQHSLHVTLSVYQQQAYANLLEKLMPIVLKRAVSQSVALRRGLPLHTWQVLGESQSRSVHSQSRNQLVENVQNLVRKHLMPSVQEIDEAVDQLAKKFQHEALPPTLLPEEKLRTVFGSRNEVNAQGYCNCDYIITEETSVRLLRANILRLVKEEDGSNLRIYHHMDNALEYCKYEPTFMEILPAEGAAVEVLIAAYPSYIKVGQLPMKNADRKVEVALALWERGLLMTEKPLYDEDR
ncbi:bifunctional lysine-specific demethylase and histidyl-hydroxylase NO66 [Drosophila gunungcola]|nr:bifunctional lysine-specific demethylase and histidyl-hydroxylase NO66 [Drosophila gunungcola]XP_052849260.1 bifunctional lysine-specific demethylase and histidyl-hydroxylase NO66 [Drosophila gunungcola]